MDDAGLVHDLQRARDFLEERDRLVGGQRILQARLEIAAREIFHRQEFDALVDAVVEQVDDRRMIERGDGLELALEHDRALAGVVAGLVRSRVLALGNLERDVVAEILGDREIDGRGFRLADLLQDGVARDLVVLAARPASSPSRRQRQRLEGIGRPDRASSRRPSLGRRLRRRRGRRRRRRRRSRGRRRGWMRREGGSRRAREARTRVRRDVNGLRAARGRRGERGPRVSDAPVCVEMCVGATRAAGKLMSARSTFSILSAFSVGRGFRGFAPGALGAALRVLLDGAQRELDRAMQPRRSEQPLR